RKRQDASNLFKVGDLVMLDGRNLRTRRPTKKFDHKLYGPFKIIKKIGENAFELDLSEHPTMRVHPVFNVALLEPYRSSSYQRRKTSPLACLRRPMKRVTPTRPYTRRRWSRRYLRKRRNLRCGDKQKK